MVLKLSESEPFRGFYTKRYFDTRVQSVNAFVNPHFKGEVKEMAHNRKSDSRPSPHFNLWLIDIKIWRLITRV